MRTNKIEKLVKVLSEKGISDVRVLQAMLEIPRHEFLDGVFDAQAYEDMSLPIGHKQTISQPFIVARMTELLISETAFEARPLGEVLEIGAGCGYQTAVLSKICRKVFAIERIEQLCAVAKKNLKKLNINNFEVRYGDGYEGWKIDKKFDGILCAAAAPLVPKKLKQQLNIGAKLVCPIGDQENQKLMTVKRISKEGFEEELIENVLFVPMLEGVD